MSDEPKVRVHPVRRALEYLNVIQSKDPGVQLAAVTTSYLFLGAAPNLLFLVGAIRFHAWSIAFVILCALFSQWRLWVLANERKRVGSADS